MNIRAAAALATLASLSACIGPDATNGSEPTSPIKIGASHTGPVALAIDSSSKVAPPTSAPIIPSNSAGSSLSGFAVIGDDFSKYASTADLLNNITRNAGGTGDQSRVLYNDGTNAQLLELDRTVLYNGHPTLKYNQPGGVGSTPEMWASLKSGSLGTMWFRGKIRFGPGFTTTGTLVNSSNAYKLIGWGWENSYGSGRVEITNTDQYQLMWGGINPTTSQATTGITFGIGGNISGEWHDGAWYDYIVEYHIISPTSAIARLWIAKDGSTPVLRTTSASNALAGATVPRVGNINIGMNFNQTRAANQTQALWWGQWEVVDGDQHPDPFGVNGGSN
jgi:hypothetical protein